MNRSGHSGPDRSPAGAQLPLHQSGTPPTGMERRDALADALSGAWGDWIADTGRIPDCFTIHGSRTTLVEADFGRGNFAGHVLGWLTAAGYLLVHPSTSAEDCMDPWVCCIHERPEEYR